MGKERGGEEGVLFSRRGGGGLRRQAGVGVLLASRGWAGRPRVLGYI